MHSQTFRTGRIVTPNSSFTSRMTAASCPSPDSILPLGGAQYPGSGPSGPCITNDHRPPDLNSQTLNVLVNPAGPHQRANLCVSLNAANTWFSGAAISREVRNVVIDVSMQAGG